MCKIDTGRTLEQCLDFSVAAYYQQLRLDSPPMLLLGGRVGVWNILCRNADPPLRTNDSATKVIKLIIYKCSVPVTLVLHRVHCCLAIVICISFRHTPAVQLSMMPVLSTILDLRQQSFARQRCTLVFTLITRLQPRPVIATSKNPDIAKMQTPDVYCTSSLPLSITVNNIPASLRLNRTRCGALKA